MEEVYRVGGKYDREIRRIVGHLEDAIAFAPPATADALRALIRFYTTGDEADRVAYDIAWVRDQDNAVDTINGFIEVYLDPRGTKGAWEGMVCYVNHERTRRIETLATHAQWFEDHTPWSAEFRKPEVLGVTAKAIDVLVETGDSGPLTPVGINLPERSGASGNGTAASRCRSSTSTRRTNGPRPRRCAASSAGTPPKWSARSAGAGFRAS